MAIEINRDSVLYRLMDLLGKDLVAVAGEPRIRFHLPNLRCRNLDLSWGGDQLLVHVTVDNVGSAKAAACDVVASVWLSSEPPGMTHRLQARCPKLGVGDSDRLDLGTLPNVAEGQFANVSLTVDPPTPAHPGGEVWESDKTDNMCFNGIYTALLEPREPPSKDGEPTRPPAPPIRKEKQG